jgi:hypothetical protein
MSGVAARLLALPTWVQVPAAAVAAGLALGLLSGLVLLGAGVDRRDITMEEPWTVRNVPFDELAALLAESPNWARGADPEPEPEEEDTGPPPIDPTRPGAFKHLELIAILRGPEPVAVFRPQKMPEAMRQLVLSSPDNTGLLRVLEGDEIVQGWVVSGITDTMLLIDQLEGDEVLEYRLFDWQRLNGSN